MAANSPYLFGHDLWAETRIPLFEQSVRVGGSAYANRVSFGLRHVSDSIMDCFEANRKRYPTLLPQLVDSPPEKLTHLRLHNGTIWRWNRPLVGFSENGDPHFRIEQRVAAAGPTMIDMVANAAFYYGALTELLNNPRAIDELIPNRIAARNFYQCAKHGLDAQVRWQNDAELPVRSLILDRLLPIAKQGLLTIGYDKAEAEYWLDIIEQRTETGQNGASWQRKWVANNGKDFKNLVLEYRENQATNSPVHTWAN